MAELLTLPEGFTRLDARGFERTFTKVLMADLFRHICRQTKATVEQVSTMVTRLTADGKLAFAKAPNGDPAVFTAARPLLTEEERPFAAAAVSYFDTTGSFNQETGDIEQGSVMDMNAKMAELDALQQQFGGLATDRGLALKPVDLKALAVLSYLVGTEPATVLTSYQKLLAEYTPEQTDGFVPTVEVFVKAAAKSWVEHASGQHPEDEARAAAFRRDIEALYTASTAEEVLALREELVQLPLAKDLSFGNSAALAYFAHRLAFPVGEVLARFVEWRQTNPDADAGEFYNYVMPDAEARTVVSEGYQRFRKYVNESIAHPQPGDPVTTLPDASLDDWINEEYPDAVHRLSSATNISRRVVREVLDRWHHTGILKFVRVPHGEKTRIAGVLPHGWPELVDASRSERTLKDEFTRQFKLMTPQAMNHVSEKLLGGRLSDIADSPALHIGPKGFTEALAEKMATVPPGQSQRTPRPGEHTYMRAIEAQYATLTGMLQLHAAAQRVGTPVTLSTRGIDGVEELFETDIAALKRADTFCWFQEPILAVEAAAASLPDSVRLTRDLTEHFACWWYFSRPAAIKTADESEAVHALLWTWLENYLYISVYVPNAEQTTMIGPNALVPTSKFTWTEGETLAHALRRIRAECVERRAQWSPDSQLKHPFGDMTIDETVAAIERLLRFFVAGSLWIQQTILVQSKGTIERHVRKRIDKTKVFERPLSDVQIIQLRRRESVTPVKSGDSKAVEWSCRWIVKGHWRNQFYPSKGSYQPKWINAFDKGPSDLPLKVPSHRVYAVSR